MTYSEKLKDPRWQKRRLDIFERDEWRCQNCGDEKSPLAVHHMIYKRGSDPWNYEDEDLLTLCESCHQEETDQRQNAEECLIEALKHSGLLARNIWLLAEATSYGRVKILPLTKQIAPGMIWVPKWLKSFEQAKVRATRQRVKELKTKAEG